MSDKKQEQPSEKPKEKKVKVIYYDDGSTVVDMSGTRRKGQPTKATRRERMRTFFAVMKKMVIPMLITLAVLTLIYIVIYFLG